MKAGGEDEGLNTKEAPSVRTTVELAASGRANGQVFISKKFSGSSTNADRNSLPKIEI